jgi:hypothetical protein
MYALDILKDIQVTPADYDEVDRLFGKSDSPYHDCEDALALAMAIIRRKGPRHNRLLSVDPLVADEAEAMLEDLHG